MTYNDDDQSNVRVINVVPEGYPETYATEYKPGDAKLPELAPHPNWEEVEFDSDLGWNSGLPEAPAEKLPHFGLRTPTERPEPPLSPEAQERRDIINRGTDLTYAALDLLKRAVETISIVDITARDRYEKLIKDVSSAADDFERKL